MFPKINLDLEPWSTQWNKANVRQFQSEILPNMANFFQTFLDILELYRLQLEHFSNWAIAGLPTTTVAFIIQVAKRLKSVEEGERPIDEEAEKSAIAVSSSGERMSKERMEAIRKSVGSIQIHTDLTFNTFWSKWVDSFWFTIPKFDELTWH